MFLTTTWKDFEVLDTGDGEKLERWGDVILRRPDPQTIWPKADPALWRQAQAWYHRSDKGGGEWEFFSRLPEKWVIAHEALRFTCGPRASSIRGFSRSRRPTGFGWRRSCGSAAARICGC